MRATVLALALSLASMPAHSQQVAALASEAATPAVSSSAATSTAMTLVRPAPPICTPQEHSDTRCRFHWKKAVAQSFLFMGLQHLGNIPTYTFKGPFLHNYAYAVTHQRFSRWSDDDPFMVDYIGHPMSGATNGFVFLQNDPQYAGMRFGNNRPYWMSRLKAMGWAAAWSVQWEIGPLSEASFGPLGAYKYWSKSAHKMTNGTGLVDFVMTPVGGTTWIVGEDLLDRYFISRVERRTGNRLCLLGVSALNPNRSVANLLRLKAPWYRDGRQVRSEHLQLPQ